MSFSKAKTIGIVAVILVLAGIVFASQWVLTAPTIQNSGGSGENNAACGTTCQACATGEGKCTCGENCSALCGASCPCKANPDSGCGCGK